MLLEGLLRLIGVGVLAAIWGCATTPSEMVPRYCGDPPHSQFHPVPTKPVFENGILAPTFLEAPIPPPDDPPDPELPPPAPNGDEPQLLPEISSKPISFERPSSRRRG